MKQLRNLLRHNSILITKTGYYSFLVNSILRFFAIGITCILLNAHLAINNRRPFNIKEVIYIYNNALYKTERAPLSYLSFNKFGELKYNPPTTGLLPVKSIETVVITSPDSLSNFAL